MLLPTLSSWTQHHCSFCDDFLLGRAAHICHFVPKSRAPELAFEWENLYISCPRCNVHQGARFDARVVRPDDPDYEFQRYFAIDAENAALRPNPAATPEEQERALATIELWALNRDDLRAARKIESMKFQRSEGVPIENFAFRDFLLQLGESGPVLHRYLVESLTIRDIKCFKNTKIDFYRHEPTSVIIGANARGKSTILQLLALGLCGIERIDLDHSWRDVVRKGARDGEFSIQLRHGDRVVALPYRVAQDDLVHYAGDIESLELIKSTVLVVGYGVNRHLTYQESATPSDVAPVASLFGDNSHLKSLRQDLTENFDSIQPLINALFAQADDGHRIALTGYDVSEGFRFSSSASPGTSLPLQALSDGFKSTFVWMLDLILRLLDHGIDLAQADRAAAIVLLDEIDLHLHPRWQRTISSTLREQFPEVQFIVTTHSPFVVQALDLRDVIHLRTSSEHGVSTVSKERPLTLSYGAIVSDSELFGMSARFSAEIEAQLDRFRSLKRAVINGEPFDEDGIARIASELANRGGEIASVIRRELLELEHRKPGIEQRIKERMWNS